MSAQSRRTTGSSEWAILREEERFGSMRSVALAPTWSGCPSPEGKHATILIQPVLLLMIMSFLRHSMLDFMRDSRPSESSRLPRCRIRLKADSPDLRYAMPQRLSETVRS